MVGSGKEPGKPVHVATRELDVTRGLKRGALLVRTEHFRRAHGKVGDEHPLMPRDPELNHNNRESCEF